MSAAHVQVQFKDNVDTVYVDYFTLINIKPCTVQLYDSFLGEPASFSS